MATILYEACSSQGVERAELWAQSSSCFESSNYKGMTTNSPVGLEGSTLHRTLKWPGLVRL